MLCLRAEVVMVRGGAQPQSIPMRLERYSMVLEVAPGSYSQASVTEQEATLSKNKNAPGLTCLKYA